MSKRIVSIGVAIVAVATALFIPVGGAAPSPVVGGRAPEMDLSAFSAARPDTALRLLFIHHSCGGQLFADVGAEQEVADCILVTHPNGGGLRSLLVKDGYDVHEASYGSDIGEKTDLLDWPPKFRSKMDKILATSKNDEVYGDSRSNQVVLFKSCYPNSAFVAEGTAPGDAAGPELTVWNAKASLTALLPEFQKRPDVLFVYVTAPPLARGAGRERVWKWLTKRALGKPSTAELEAREGALARTFNDWAKSPEGWLKGYPEKNVVVFDYYDILSGDGASNHSQFPTKDGSDSHPAAEGQRKAAGAFVPFLNRAVRRAGLSR